MFSCVFFSKFSVRLFIQHGVAVTRNSWTFAWWWRWPWSQREYQCACGFHPCVGRFSTKYWRFLCSRRRLFQTRMATSRSNLYIHFLRNCSLHHRHNIERCGSGKLQVLQRRASHYLISFFLPDPKTFSNL